MKRKIIYFLSAILMIALCLSFTACDDDNVPSEITDDYFKNVNMPLVYEIYLDYMEEIGETPLTYEEWFEVINGDEFQKGIIPEIRKNDMTDFWEISYNNGKGWNDLRFKTETEAQKNCKHSFGKWIVLCEANDYFNGIRYQSCKHCNYKNYQFKLNDNVCLHLELETIPAKLATCDAEGYTDGKKCSKCSEIVIEQDIIPAKGHNYVSVVTDPTCTTTGYTTYTCHCGDSYIADEVAVLKHIFGEWVTIKEATATEEGLKEAYCACGNKKTAIIPMTISWNIYFRLNDDGMSYSVARIPTDMEVDSIVIIPDIFYGLPVTGIDDWAFYHSSTLTSIVIPDSITSIGHGIFSDCSALESIIVEEGNDVYHSAGNCLIETASKTLIAGCKNSVIPKDGSVTSIGEYAFYRCESITSIVIPDNVKSIGRRAFTSCSSLTSVVVEDVVISGGLMNIGKEAFRDCNSLTSIVITDSITTISSRAFYNCSNLTSIVINENVTSIGEEAFVGCKSFTSIVIPDSITTISSRAFYNCSNLTSIVINENVTSIGDSAFRRCSSLTSIEFKGTIAQWYAISKGSDWDLDTGDYTVYCIDTCRKHNFENGICTECGSSYYSKGLNYSLIDADSYSVTGMGTCTDTEVVIPSSYNGLPVTKISNSAFKSQSNIISIKIPNSVTSIGNQAFSGCDSLTSVEIPDSVTSIGRGAFGYCHSLTTVTIGHGVTSIGRGAFEYCHSLRRIDFRGTEAEWNAVSKDTEWDNHVENYVVFYIGTCLDHNLENHICTVCGVFVYSDGFEYTQHGSDMCSITGIGTCTDTCLYIPKYMDIYMVTGIDSGAFEDCDSLTSVVIPDSVTSIDNHAFSDCDSLTSVVIPGSVTSISDWAFGDCSSLTSIVIPDSVTSISDCAFFGCSSLTSVVIPDSVTSIGSDAFAYCRRLTSIEFKGTIAQWDDITKAPDWDYMTTNYIVYCTDGTITK